MKGRSKTHPTFGTFFFLIKYTKPASYCVDSASFGRVRNPKVQKKVHKYKV